MHFGGGANGSRKRPFPGIDGEDDNGVKKTRAEMMEEIIAKSKLHKVSSSSFMLPQRPD